MKIEETLGKKVERKVAEIFTREGKKVIFQENTSAPFDLIIDKKRIDVKSAHRSKNTGGSYRYVFQLQDVTERKSIKDFYREIDFFYLVFLDEPQTPVYELSVDQVKIQSTLSITDFKNTKYKLNYLTALSA